MEQGTDTCAARWITWQGLTSSTSRDASALSQGTQNSAAPVGICLREPEQRLSTMYTSYQESGHMASDEACTSGDKYPVQVPFLQ